MPHTSIFISQQASSPPPPLSFRDAEEETHIVDVQTQIARAAIKICSHSSLTLASIAGRRRSSPPRPLSSRMHATLYARLRLSSAYTRRVGPMISSGMFICATMLQRSRHDQRSDRLVRNRTERNGEGPQQPPPPRHS